MNSRTGSSTILDEVEAALHAAATEAAASPKVARSKSIRGTPQEGSVRGTPLGSVLNTPLQRSSTALSDLEADFEAHGYHDDVFGSSKKHTPEDESPIWAVQEAEMFASPHHLPAVPEAEEWPIDRGVVTLEHPNSSGDSSGDSTIQIVQMDDILPEDLHRSPSELEHKPDGSEGENTHSKAVDIFTPPPSPPLHIPTYEEKHPCFREEMSLRKKIFHTLEDPTFTKLATAISIFMNLVVILSVIISIIYRPQFTKPNWQLQQIDILVNAIFTAEYLLKFSVATERHRWIIKPPNILDFISLVPFYIEIITNDTVAGLQLIRFIRLLRVARLVSVLKMVKFYKHLLKKRFKVKQKHIKLKYLLANIFEQIHAVVPLTLFVVLFQYVIMGVLMSDMGIIVGGQILVIVGLFLFIEGINHGLVPVGSKIGEMLPRKVPMWALYIITFITGIIVTFAEPAVVSLTVVGSYIPRSSKPYHNRPL